MINWLCRYAPAAAALFDGRSPSELSILDVGCGAHGLACIEPDVPFVGFDVDFQERVAPTMLAVQAPAGPLPFEDASFDAVLCLDALEHVPPDVRAGVVEEVARVSAGAAVVACPTSDAQLVDDFVRDFHRMSGRPVPQWLVEHDSEGLPHPDEVAAYAQGVDGFTAREAPMPNGLLVSMVTLGDVLPSFMPAALHEARANGAEWAELLRSASFGVPWRRAWVLERDEARVAAVHPDRLEDTALAALRCPGCGAGFERAEAATVRCDGCGRLSARDVRGVWNLASDQPSWPVTHRSPAYLCEPTWDPGPLARVVDAFLSRGDRGGALLLRADPVSIATDRAVSSIHAALAGRPLPESLEIHLLHEPMTAADLERIRGEVAVVDEAAPESLAA